MSRWGSTSSSSPTASRPERPAPSPAGGGAGGGARPPAPPRETPPPGGGPPPRRAPRPPPPAPRPRRVGIGGFFYDHGALSADGAPRRPPVIHAGQSISFTNYDATASV